MKVIIFLLQIMMSDQVKVLSLIFMIRVTRIKYQY